MTSNSPIWSLVSERNVILHSGGEPIAGITGVDPSGLGLAKAYGKRNPILVFNIVPLPYCNPCFPQDIQVFDILLRGTAEPIRTA